MLGQRRRRLTNNKPTLVQRLAFAGLVCHTARSVKRLPSFGYYLIKGKIRYLGQLFLMNIMQFQLTRAILTQRWSKDRPASEYIYSLIRGDAADIRTSTRKVQRWADISSVGRDIILCHNTTCICCYVFILPRMLIKYWASVTNCNSTLKQHLINFSCLLIPIAILINLTLINTKCLFLFEQLRENAVKNMSVSV